MDEPFQLRCMPFPQPAMERFPLGMESLLLALFRDLRLEARKDPAIDKMVAMTPPERKVPQVCVLRPSESSNLRHREGFSELTGTGKLYFSVILEDILTLGLQKVLRAPVQGRDKRHNGTILSPAGTAEAKNPRKVPLVTLFRP